MSFFEILVKKGSSKGTDVSFLGVNTKAKRTVDRVALVLPSAFFLKFDHPCNFSFLYTLKRLAKNIFCMFFYLLFFWAKHVMLVYLTAIDCYLYSTQLDNRELLLCLRSSCFYLVLMMDIEDR